MAEPKGGSKASARAEGGGGGRARERLRDSHKRKDLSDKIGLDGGERQNRRGGVRMGEAAEVEKRR